MKIQEIYLMLFLNQYCTSNGSQVIDQSVLRSSSGDFGTVFYMHFYPALFLFYVHYLSNKIFISGVSHLQKKKKNRAGQPVNEKHLL